MHSNSILNFTGNPLICDCIATEMKEMIEGTLEGDFIHLFKLASKEIRCGPKSSEALQNQLLGEVDYADLTCPFPSSYIELDCTDRCSCSLNRKFKETIIDCSNRSMTTFPSNLIFYPFSLLLSLCISMTSSSLYPT